MSPTASGWRRWTRYGLVSPSFLAPPELEELRRLTRPVCEDPPTGVDAAQHAAPHAG